MGGWLPRHESWEWARHRIPQGRRLCRVCESDAESERADCDASDGILPDGNSLPSGIMAPRGRRFESLDAVADDRSRASLALGIMEERTRLARAVQGIQDPARWALLDRLTIC